MIRSPLNKVKTACANRDRPLPEPAQTPCATPCHSLSRKEAPSSLKPRDFGNMLKAFRSPSCSASMMIATPHLAIRVPPSSAKTMQSIPKPSGAKVESKYFKPPLSNNKMTTRPQSKVNCHENAGPNRRVAEFDPFRSAKTLPRTPPPLESSIPMPTNDSQPDQDRVVTADNLVTEMADEHATETFQDTTARSATTDTPTRNSGSLPAHRGCAKPEITKLETPAESADKECPVALDSTRQHGECPVGGAPLPPPQPAAAAVSKWTVTEEDLKEIADDFDAVAVPTAKAAAPIAAPVPSPKLENDKQKVPTGGLWKKFNLKSPLPSHPIIDDTASAASSQNVSRSPCPVKVPTKFAAVANEMSQDKDPVPVAAAAEIFARSTKIKRSPVSKKLQSGEIRGKASVSAEVSAAIKAVAVTQLPPPPPTSIGVEWPKEDVLMKKENEALQLKMQEREVRETELRRNKELLDKLQTEEEVIRLRLELRAEKSNRIITSIPCPAMIPPMPPPANDIPYSAKEMTSKTMGSPAGDVTCSPARDSSSEEASCGTFSAPFLQENCTALHETLDFKDASFEQQSEEQPVDDFFLGDVDMSDIYKSEQSQAMDTVDSPLPVAPMPRRQRKKEDTGTLIDIVGIPYHVEAGMIFEPLKVVKKRVRTIAHSAHTKERSTNYEHKDADEVDGDNEAGNEDAMIEPESPVKKKATRTKSMKAAVAKQEPKHKQKVPEKVPKQKFVRKKESVVTTPLSEVMHVRDVAADSSPLKKKLKVRQRKSENELNEKNADPRTSLDLSDAVEDVSAEVETVSPDFIEGHEISDNETAGYLDEKPVVTAEEPDDCASFARFAAAKRTEAVELIRALKGPSKSLKGKLPSARDIDNMLVEMWGVMTPSEKVQFYSQKKSIKSVAVESSTGNAIAYEISTTGRKAEEVELSSVKPVAVESEVKLDGRRNQTVQVKKAEKITNGKIDVVEQRVVTSEPSPVKDERKTSIHMKRSKKLVKQVAVVDLDTIEEENSVDAMSVQTGDEENDAMLLEGKLSRVKTMPPPKKPSKHSGQAKKMAIPKLKTKAGI